MKPALQLSSEVALLSLLEIRTTEGSSNTSFSHRKEYKRVMLTMEHTFPYFQNYILTRAVRLTVRNANDCATLTFDEFLQVCFYFGQLID